MGEEHRAWVWAAAGVTRGREGLLGFFINLSPLFCCLFFFLLEDNICINIYIKRLGSFKLYEVAHCQENA